ncbi:MAG: hypothetical protein IH950_02460 [Bacteroidetes bacterium]|nr:hypothetical protein [Bacteroidota bacterium]
MNKIYKQLLLFIGIIITIGILSCDELENLFINLKISQEITASGDGPISATDFFCLSDFDEIQDNIDNIQEIIYVAAAYRTLSSTPGLTGDIFASLVSDDGTTMFSVTIPGVMVEDFIDNPFEIVLTQAQIDLFNAYLADYQNKDCYTTTLSVTNISAGSGPPYSLTGVVEIVVEIKTKI